MIDAPLNFTPRVHQALKLSKKIAISLKHESVDLNHFFCGLFKVQGSFFNKILEPSTDVNDIINYILSKFPSNEDFLFENFSFHKSLKLVLQKSVDTADYYGHEYIGIEHVLINLLQDKLLKELLHHFNVNVSHAVKTITLFLEGGNTESIPYSPTKSTLSLTSHTHSNKSSLYRDLESFSFCFNVQHAADQGLYSHLSFPKQTIDQLVEILSRKTKNNPLIIGDPGVGKTAFIECLSHQISIDAVPSNLSNKIIVSLNLSSLVAGTKYRGQFEEKLQQFINFASMEPDIIVFIDEIHSLTGVGQAEGGMDAANILKPYLARGEITCIGATTYQEYKNIFSKDNALDRRFQIIDLPEPDKIQCVHILKHLSSSYEKFHHVKFRSNVFDACYELSSKYIPERRLPDKAIDLLDESAAKVKLTKLRKPQEILSIEKELECLMDKNSADQSDQDQVLEDLFSRYQSLLDSWHHSIQKEKVYVTKHQVEELISQKTGIPLKIIQSSNGKNFLNLQKSLSKFIIGQSEALDSIQSSILRAVCGLNNSDKPLSSFLFLGGTGTGKTFTAKKVADFVFGSKNSFIRVDMGEFTESASVSKLTGAAPGYIGYDEGSGLLDQVTRNPYSLILFDEIEKAHPEILKVLLSILDEGCLTSSSGKKVSFKNCLIIMTGNLGSDLVSKNGGSIGFSTENPKNLIKDKVVEKIKKDFSPEFFNRIDELIIFNSFEEDSYKLIIDNYLSALNKKLKNKFVKITLSESLYEHFINKIQSLNLGARPIERLFKLDIETSLAKILLKRTFNKLTTINYYLHNGAIKNNLIVDKK